jgi:hypothetical protein
MGSGSLFFLGLCMSLVVCLVLAYARRRARSEPDPVLTPVTRGQREDFVVSSQVEFFVSDVKKNRSGVTVFVGFPNKGGAVHVGDTFIARYEVPRTMDDIVNQRPLASPINYCDVMLKVEAIESMRVRLNELPIGVTGGLYLAGSGLEFVTKNSLLST